MTPEQIQAIAEGLPPSAIGKDYEEVVTWLANQLIALQLQVNALAAENIGMDKFVNKSLQAAWQGGSLDGADIQEMALKNGLLRKEPYCAELHENMTDDPGNFEEGDDFFIRIDTPATESIKLQWMAEGVGASINRLIKKFECTGHIGVPVMALESLAAQLRQPEGKSF